MRRGVLVGSVAILLLLGSALLWTSLRPPPGDAVPARDDAPQRGPGLAAAPASVPARPAPKQEVSRLGPEVETALGAALALTAQSDATAVQTAIAALSRALCAEGDAHRAILERVLGAREASERAVRAVILALGRCGREEVLRPLVAALRDPATPMRERESIALALGQPRQAEFVAPDGVPVMSSGDANLTGPIRERFVLDALLQTAAERANTVASRRLRYACLQALVGSAGDADDVLDALAALGRAEPDQRGSILSLLTLARPGQRLTAYARPIATDRGSDESSLQGSLSLWLRGDLTGAIDYVLSELESPDATDARKALLIRHVSGFGAVGAEATADIERLVVACVAWARAHPKVVTHHERQMGPPGTPTIPVELDTLDVAAGLASNARGATRGRSPVVLKLAADLFVERLGRHSTGEEHRRPPRWLSNRLEGDDAYMLLVLEGLRTAPLDDDTLLDVVDVLTGPRPGYPPRSAAVEAAIVRVAERLTPAARERLEARRREAKPR